MTVHIGIIMGSTRQAALGARIFTYLQHQFPDTETVQYTWLDLRDYPLPLYDHPETPLEDSISHPTATETQWLNALAAQDGYVILTPEYDHALPGGLKNALDLVGPQVDHKPVQIVAYSYFSDGGVLAVQSLVPILQMLKMIILPEPVLLWSADPNFTQDGTLVKSVVNSDHFALRLADAMHDIIFYAQLLHNHPYLSRV
ncbi:MAG: NAD(P)H-dependent oxidoreductase [Schleiferilactobacillus perolens]|uniref:NADPH-dependent FMN reductase n=1 Tax=Schleiferilactobacillus perolens TaxID=100468 RepID=UPI0039E8FF2A